MDGAGSNLDADLLDGNSSAHFATASSVSDHLADTSDAHDASAISILDSANQYTATDAEGALAEVLDALQAHEADTVDAHDATAISFAPHGSIAATTVQAAIQEVRDEAGGGGGGSGEATLDFGAFPGATDATLDVTGQTSIASGSLVQAWIFPEDTADHTADEHWVENIKVLAGSVVAGVGFTIYGMTTDDTSLYGVWNVAWRWA